MGLRRLLNGAKAAAKLSIGVAQRDLGVKPQPAGQHRQREQEIAQLLSDMGRIIACGSSPQFSQFLSKLGPSPFNTAPAKARSPGLFGQRVSRRQGRQRRWDTVERAGPCAALCGQFLSLDLLPVMQHLARTADLQIAKNMGVPPDQLGRNALKHIAKPKATSLAGHLALGNYRQQQVAKLLAERAHIACLKRLKHLMRLLKQRAAQRCVGLLAIPRAASRAVEPGHYPGQPIEPA